MGILAFCEIMVSGEILLIRTSFFVSQAYHMDRTRLQPHSVPRLSSLWWKWVVSTFIEGFHNFWRFDAIVERERRRKEKAKH